MIAMLFAALVLRLMVQPAEIGQVSPVQVLVVHGDSTHTMAKLPLDVEAVAGAKHFWAWTEQLPPRKFEARLLSEEQILERLREPGIRPLEIELRGWSRSEELESLRIIVAPAEMWGYVPESLLPSFPVSREGALTVSAREAMRIRATGQERGSVWEETTASARSLHLQLRHAAEAELRFESSDGTAVKKVFATAMIARRGMTPALQAQFTTDERGILRIGSLPHGAVISLLVNAKNAAPQTLSGTVTELRRVVRLQPAAKVAGRFVDEDGNALEGVRIDAEAWMSSEVAALMAGHALSDESGRWIVAPLPRGRVSLRAAAKGRVTFRKEVAVVERDADLGTITLPAAIQLQLVVVDAEDRPLEVVRVTTDSGVDGKTDENGVAIIAGLAAGEPVAISLSLEGFAKRKLELAPPLPKHERVSLERSFLVKGSLVADAGRPLRNAAIMVAIGNEYRREPVDEQGVFTFPVEADTEFELSFESSSTRRSTQKEVPGRPGEIRDLGRIVLPVGAVVRGMVIDGSGTPVAGARVWMLPPNAAGDLASWAAGRMLEAGSNGDGTFELSGLTPGPALVRVDAHGFARAYRSITVEDSSVELEPIELLRGSAVDVKFRSSDSAIARIDLRNQWLEIDMLTAPVVEGVARVRNVPPGHYLATVLEQGAVVCQRNVDVEDDDVTVVCPPAMIVRGRVRLDGVPAYGGFLVWTRSVAEVPALIQTRRSPLGASQQRVYGIGSGTVPLAVNLDGTFETDRLQPGEWQVTWRSSEGAAAQRAVALPEGTIVSVDIDFDGSIIRGRVLDAQSKPVAGATVRHIGGSFVTRSGPDGSFGLSGFQPGRYRLQSFLGARESRMVEVQVERGQLPEEVILQLDETERNILTVEVIDHDGLPKPSAFVFVEAIGGTRILTADRRGIATGSFSGDMPDVARLVAFAGDAWAFGELRRTAEAGPRSGNIRFQETGILEMRSRTLAGSPSILSSRAGDLTWMMGRVGYHLSVAPDAPVVVRGLPEGTYIVRLGAAEAMVSVARTKPAVVELP